MSHVKDYPALSAFPKRGIHFARLDLLVAKPGVKVGVDVARPELTRHEFTQWALGVIDSKVDHDGDIRQRTCFDGAFNRRPFRAGVVGRLDAYDQILVAERHFRRRPGFHVRKVLLKLSAPHAIADDIDERQHTGLRTIDETLLEGLGGIDFGRNGGNLSVRNGDITNGAYLVFGIDDMAAL